MSKGSRQRPFDDKKFGDNYDKIFGNNNAGKTETKTESTGKKEGA